MKKLFCVPILCMVLLSTLSPACPAHAAGNKQLEVFSWWTSGGEAMALESLFKVYKYKNPGVEVLNAAVTGGGGSAARPVLQTRHLADPFGPRTPRPVRPRGLLRSRHGPLPE
jgi:hypothetical protein